MWRRPMWRRPTWRQPAWRRPTRRSLRSRGAPLQREPGAFRRAQCRVDVGELARHAAQLDEVGLYPRLRQLQLEVVLAQPEARQLGIDSFPLAPVGVLRQPARGTPRRFAVAAVQSVAAVAP